MITEKILIVDDEQTICDSVEKILSKKGFSIDKALNAESALKKMSEEKYELVITDLMMPKTSGMELIEIIRKHYPELNVIMITGYASFESAVSATKLGALGYLAKPFTPDELLTVTSKALESRKSDQDKKDVQSNLDNKQDDLIDVDLPFSERDLERRTSKEYIEALTHSDIPLAKKIVDRAYCQTGKRDCRRVITEGKECAGECPIEKKEKARSKSVKRHRVFSNEIIDVDMPFAVSEMAKYISEDYFSCLDRSDIPRAALYGKNITSKSNVLVIDDEPIVCQSVRKILTKQKYVVDEVFDVDAAMNKMKINKYDLILLDLKMPKRSGMEVLDSIKRTNPNLPVIMITGYGTIETAVEATRLGAFNFIPKPFTPEELTKVTEEALA